MSLRKMLASAAVVGAVATAGLLAAPAAQAVTTTEATVTATEAGPTQWVPWGTYSSQGACFYAGNWAVMNAGASYFNCYQIAPDQWALELWRP